MAKKYWLMKTEPGVYSIDDLERDGYTWWEGVRNYGARNNMQAMSVGDEVLFYHSMAKPPGVAGLARVCKEAYPDHFAFDPDEHYYDPKSDPAKPRWYMVDVEFVEKFPAVVSLRDIRQVSALSEMVLVKNSRLSVQPVGQEEFEIIRGMGRGEG